MDMKLKESKEREESIERLHNIMLKAFKNDPSTTKQANFVQEYEYLSEMHRKEMNEAVKSYEMQINHLKEKNSDLQDKIDSLTHSCDSMQKQIKLFERNQLRSESSSDDSLPNKRLLAENSELEKKVLLLQKDQEIKDRVMVERLVMENTRQKENAEFQLKLQKEKSEEVFKQKEDNWKQQLEKAQEEIDKLKKETLKEKGFNLNSLISLEKQVAELTKELQLTKKENQEYLKSLKTYEKQIDQMKNAPIQYMDLTEDEDDLYSLVRQNQNMEEELTRKDQELKALNSHFKSLLNKEKEKVTIVKDKMVELRDKYDHKKTKLLEEMLEKDEQIVKLTKQLRDNSNAHTPTSATFSTASNFRNRQSELENLSVTEYKLLRMCQRMVDSSSRMECNKCEAMFVPTVFYEHISGKDICSGFSDDSEFTMCLDDEVSAIGNGERYNNLLSNKNSRLDLNCPVPRPHSASRREFQFGKNNV